MLRYDGNFGRQEVKTELIQSWFWEHLPIDLSFNILYGS